MTVLPNLDALLSLLPDRVFQCGVCLQRVGCGRPAAHPAPEGDVRGRHHGEPYALFVFNLAHIASFTLPNSAFLSS